MLFERSHGIYAVVRMAKMVGTPFTAFRGSSQKAR
jgi:hypothetical protein